MRRTSVTTAFTITAATALLSAGCGWSPHGPGPRQPDNCTTADAPGPGVVSSAVKGLPAGPWVQKASGHTSNCALYWVQVGPAEAQPDSPQQVLFFTKNTPLGTATPNPRPYVTVTAAAPDTATVQYQWQQASDQPGRPTGIGSVRFTIADGKLKALDPIPGPAS